MSQKRKLLKRRAQKSKGTSVARRDASGRTHLVVQRDAQGRPHGLALSHAVFNEEWQNQVALAAATTALGVLKGGPTRERAIELGLNTMAGTSKIVDGVLSQSGDSSIACSAGCAHCCYQAVGVFAPEVFTIHNYLMSSVSDDVRQRSFERIRQADQRTRGLSSRELAPEYPCPFLQEGQCSIYEVRPLACRGKNSLDAKACEQSLHDPEIRQRFLAGTFSVPCYLEPIRAFHAVAAGTQLALDELFGLSMQPLELTRAMRVLIDDPGGVSEGWLSGKDTFAEARGANMSADPHIVRLSGKKTP